MTPSRIEEIVLEAIRSANRTREPKDELLVGADAPLFGSGSRLDSLGLVMLLVDIEEALHAEGVEVTLSDEKAVSRTRSPFRSVPAMVQYISGLVPADK